MNIKDFNKIKEQYNQLLQSGMFWEFYPELTGDWHKDYEYFIEYIQDKESSMESVPKSNELNEKIDGFSVTSTIYTPREKVVGNTEQSAVDYVESNYPEMTEEFKRIQREQYETFCKKQRNYGPSNISVGTSLSTPQDIKLSLTGLFFRMNDKIQRIKQLVVFGEPDEVGESVQDSFDDMSIYGIIAQIVSNGKWGK